MNFKPGTEVIVTGKYDTQKNKIKTIKSIEKTLLTEKHYYLFTDGGSCWIDDVRLATKLDKALK